MARVGRRSRRALALGWVAVMALGLGAFGSSLAYFTDSEVVTTSGLATATLDLVASPATAVLAASNLQPGDTLDGTVTLTNTGTGALRYAMTASATDADGKALRDLLTLVIKTIGTSCATFDGTTLYSGTIAAAAIGNPATGAQAGDRELASSGSEELCFRAEMPSSAGNAYQLATTTATFTFAAEQTAHNP